MKVSKSKQSHLALEGFISGCILFFVLLGGFASAVIYTLGGVSVVGFWRMVGVVIAVLIGTFIGGSIFAGSVVEDEEKEALRDLLKQHKKRNSKCE